MAQEVVAKLISINYDESHDGYMVTFWVGQEFDEANLNDAFALLGKMDGLQREVYSMLIRHEEDEYTMEPDEDLSPCLVIFDQHESSEELEQPTYRQWKTGQIAEALCTQLITANTFGVWRTAKKDNEDDTDGDATAQGTSEDD